MLIVFMCIMVFPLAALLLTGFLVLTEGLRVPGLWKILFRRPSPRPVPASAPVCQAAPTHFESARVAAALRRALPIRLRRTPARVRPAFSKMRFGKNS